MNEKLKEKDFELFFEDKNTLKEIAKEVEEDERRRSKELILI